MAVMVLVAALLFDANVTTAQDSPEASGAALPPRLDTERHVYDNANLLTDDQEESFESDLARARRLGIETVVYTRISMDDIQESQEFADRIRTEWRVESAEGADDGVVYLVTYNPSNLETNSITVSWGANTWPVRQLDEATFKDIVDDEMRPAMDDGEADLALMYGVRRVLNYAEYSPPNPAPLTSLQRTLGDFANIGTALLLQSVVVGYLLVPVIRERRFTLMPSATSLGWYAVVLALLAIVAGILAIAARSAFGSLTALAVFTWAACGVPWLASLFTRVRRRRNVVVVPPRVLYQADARTGTRGATSTVATRG
jgi:uncharacterized membrane protein YgcG